MVQCGAYVKGGHGPNWEDYLHGNHFERIVEGGPLSNGCVVAADEYAKWIYYNCGRGTPLFIW